jgi:hypothetical protein
MVIENSYLTRLIGQTIINVDTDLSYVIGLKQNKTDAGNQVMNVYVQIYFNDYRLHIYNKAEITCTDSTNRNTIDLVGLTVISILEVKDFAELHFDNGCIYKIELRDEAYTDAEAMALFGPDLFWVVWN